MPKITPTRWGLILFVLLFVFGCETPLTPCVQHEECGGFGQCVDGICKCQEGAKGQRCEQCDTQLGWHLNALANACTRDPCDPNPCDDGLSRCASDGHCDCIYKSCQNICCGESDICFNATCSWKFKSMIAFPKQPYDMFQWGYSVALNPDEAIAGAPSSSNAAGAIFIFKY